MQWQRGAGGVCRRVVAPGDRFAWAQLGPDSVAQDAARNRFSASLNKQIAEIFLGQIDPYDLGV